MRNLLLVFAILLFSVSPAAAETPTPTEGNAVLAITYYYLPG